MGKFIRQKSTGRILEWQQFPTGDVLTRNAVSSGYDPADLEEILASHEEFKAALALSPEEIQAQEIRDEEEIITLRKKEIIQKMALKELKTEGKIFKHF